MQRNRNAEWPRLAGLMRHAGHKPSESSFRSRPVLAGFFHTMNADTSDSITMNADTSDSIRVFQLLALRGALKLESLGMGRSHRPSALAMVKMLGINARTAKAALPLFEAKLRQEGILR